MTSPSDMDTSAEEKQYQVPEWEHNVATRNEHSTQPRAPAKSAFSANSTKFDRILPPKRRYLGMSRKIFLIVLLAVILALLALIIGLAVGLSKSKSQQDLPLPTNSQHFVGDLTYYQAGLGACGETDGQDDMIVSISHYVFDAAGSSSSTGGNSNANPLCGMMVRASRYDEAVGAQRSVDLKVADRCTGCQPDDLDTTIGAFEKLASVADGRVDVTWAWLEPVATGK